MNFDEFKQHLYNQYVPSMYEIYINDRVNANRRSYVFSGIELYYEVFNLIQPYISNNSNIIDIGAYPGTFLRLLRLILKEKEIKLFGQGLVCEENEVDKYNNHAEINPLTKCIRTQKPFINFMKNENIEFLDSNLDYCDSFKQETYRLIQNNLHFDMVTCMEVIEHLHTPFLLFDLFNKITKKGGVCVLETNNVAYLFGLLKLLKGGSNLDLEFVNKYSLNDLTIKHPHIRFYSLNEIKILFKKAGFKIIKSYAFNWGYPPSVYTDKKTKIIAYMKKMNIIRKYKSHIIVLAQKE